MTIWDGMWHDHSLYAEINSLALTIHGQDCLSTNFNISLCILDFYVVLSCTKVKI